MGGGPVSKTETRIPEEISPYARAAAEFLTSRIGQTGPIWVGPFTAPMSPYETTGLGGLADIYSAYSGGLGPAALSEWEKTVRGEYLPGANRYLADIDEALARDYQARLSALQTQMASAGMGPGTPYARLSSEALAQYLGERGRLMLSAYEAERARQAEAARLASAAGPTLAMSLLQAGALPRTLSQQELDRAYQEMLRAWNETYRAAGMAAPAFGTAQTTRTEYGPDPLASIMQGLFSLWITKGL